MTERGPDGKAIKVSTSGGSSGIPDSAKKIPAKQGGPTEIQTAWRILAGGAPACAEALVHVAEHGKSEVARVQAATAVLDRVGLATPKERPEVHFNVIPKEMQEVPDIGKLSPAEVIRKKLKDLKGPTQALTAGMSAEQLMDLGLGSYEGGSQSEAGAEDEDAEIVDAELMPLEDAHGDGGITDDDWGNPWG